MANYPICCANICKWQESDIRNTIYSPIYDARHNFAIYFVNDKARSNQDRFEHISKNFHELTVKDIESIPEGLTTKAKLKQEKGRKDTYNYYFIRKRDKTHFVKISVKVIDWKNRVAVVKTIFKRDR